MYGIDIIKDSHKLGNSHDIDDSCDDLISRAERMSFTYLASPEKYQSSVERQFSRSPATNKRYGFVHSDSLDDTDSEGKFTDDESSDQSIKIEAKIEQKDTRIERKKERRHSHSTGYHRNIRNEKVRDKRLSECSHPSIHAAHDNNNNNYNNNNNNNNNNRSKEERNNNSNNNNNNNNNNNIYSKDDSNEEKNKERKNSHFSINNVKRKLSHTFQRKSSTSEPLKSKSVPSTESPDIARWKDPLKSKSTTIGPSPEIARRKAPLKSKSSTFTGPTTNISPASSPAELRRYAAHMNGIHEANRRKANSMDSENVHESDDRRKNSLNLMHPFAVSRKRSTSNPLASSSNPDIKPDVPSSDGSIKDFNVYCLGTKQTGKTALTVRFLTGRYIHEYNSIPDEKYSRMMKYGEDHVNVTVFINDVDKMEEDIELSANSGIMIVYSITDKSSFKEATLLLNHLAELSITEHIPVVLIATKIDLHRLRKITQKKALDLANQYNCSQFDVSAAIDDNVQECFHAVFRQIEVRQYLKGNSDDDKTVLTARKFQRSGSFRYGTL